MSPHMIWRCGVGVAMSSLAACGSVATPSNPDAAGPADAAPDSTADGRLPSCKPTAVITPVESATAGYGDSCIRGGWTLEALNGTTDPMAVGKPANTVLVSPTRLGAGENELNTASTYAVHVSGSGQATTASQSSYAQLTASLNRGSDTDVGTVDASAFIGIQFSAKLSTGVDGLRLTVGNLYTDPAGGMCVPGGTDHTDCYDNPGIALTPHDGTWQLYEVRFDQLQQLDFGLPSPVGASFPKDAITHIKWDVGIPQTGATPAWDLVVDDIKFF